MSHKHSCILITGMGHSGTRLMVDLLAKHPDVSVPMDVINRVREYVPLHAFFVQAIDRTPLYSDDYWLDKHELAFVLDAYMTHVDPSKSYIVLKQPYYPLYYLDFFKEYFGDGLKLVYTERPLEKVIRSWSRDNAFLFQFEETLRQVKKLDVESRKYHMSDLWLRDIERYLQCLQYTCTRLRDQWNADHPADAFVTVDIETIAQSSEALKSVLQQIGLSHDDRVIENMLTIIDNKRLMTGKQPQNENRLKGVLRAVTPPALWSLMSHIKQLRP